MRDICAARASSTYGALVLCAMPAAYLQVAVVQRNQRVGFAHARPIAAWVFPASHGDCVVRPVFARSRCRFGMSYDRTGLSGIKFTKFGTARCFDALERFRWPHLPPPLGFRRRFLVFRPAISKRVHRFGSSALLAIYCC